MLSAADVWFEHWKSCKVCQGAVRYRLTRNGGLTRDFCPEGLRLRAASVGYLRATYPLAMRVQVPRPKQRRQRLDEAGRLVWVEE